MHRSEGPERSLDGPARLPGPARPGHLGGPDRGLGGPAQVPGRAGPGPRGSAPKHPRCLVYAL